MRLKCSRVRSAGSGDTGNQEVQMFRAMRTAEVLLLLVCAGAFTAAAQYSDTTPPYLVNMDVQPRVVDVRNADGWVQVTMHITDDLSGGTSAYLRASAGATNCNLHARIRLRRHPQRTSTGTGIAKWRAFRGADCICPFATKAQVPP